MLVVVYFYSSHLIRIFIPSAKHLALRCIRRVLRQIQLLTALYLYRLRNTCQGFSQISGQPHNMTYRIPVIRTIISFIINDSDLSMRPPPLFQLTTCNLFLPVPYKPCIQGSVGWQVLLNTFPLYTPIFSIGRTLPDIFSD